MPRWKMLAGKFYYRGSKFVAGDVFEAPTEEVKHMRDILQPLDKIEEYMDESERDVPRNKLLAIHKGRGNWDVVNNSTNKKMNDRPLTKTEAQQMVDRLIVEAEAVPSPELEPSKEEDLEEKITTPDPIEEKKDEPKAATKPAKTTGSSKLVERKRSVLTRRRAKLD